MLATSEVMSGKCTRNARADDHHIRFLGQVVRGSMAEEDLGWLTVPE
jgi:hypothetical protein